MILGPDAVPGLKATRPAHGTGEPDNPLMLRAAPRF